MGQILSWTFLPDGWRPRGGPGYQAMGASYSPELWAPPETFPEVELSELLEAILPGLPREKFLVTKQLIYTQAKCNSECHRELPILKKQNNCQGPWRHGRQARGWPRTGQRSG
jgi:hypothetical protein